MLAGDACPVRHRLVPGLFVLAALVIVGSIIAPWLSGWSGWSGLFGRDPDPAVTASTAPRDGGIAVTGRIETVQPAETVDPPAAGTDTGALETRLAAIEDALGRLEPGASATEIDRLIAERLAALDRGKAETPGDPDPAEAARDAAAAIVVDIAPAGSTGSPDGGPDGVPARTLSREETFLAAAAGTGTARARAAPLGDPARTIAEGTILAATLETAIDTSLPGPARALVSHDVRSWDGAAVLLPAGTRLIGTHDARISLAQRRMLIAWTRAIRPDGIAIALGGTGADRLGRAGMTGDIDNRLVERFGGALLTSLISMAPAAALAALDNSTRKEAGAARGGGATTIIETPDTTITVRDGTTTPAQASRTRDTGLVDDLVRESVRASADEAKATIGDYLRLSPVIRIAPGARLSILVTRDLTFPGAPGGKP